MNDWIEVRIGDVADLYQPKTIASKKLISNGKYSVYGANGIIGKYDKFNHQDEELLITCRGATCGNVHISEKNSWINGNAMVVKPFDKNLLGINYLKYFFSNKNKTSKAISGSAQPQITQTNLLPIEVPICSIIEQKAIVKRIEELFSSLDSGIADLKKAQDQLVIYRQAVLKKAFEGEYPQKKIIDIADVNTGATPKRGNPDFWENGTIPWVTSTVVNYDYVNEPSELITANAIKQTNCKLIPKGSLLVAMYGEGKTRAKCSELNIDTATNQALAGITLFKEYKESKQFVKWFFVKNYEEIRLLSSGGVQPNLNLSIIKNTIIPFPKPNEQHQIILEIESRLSVCDKVEESITESLEKAQALRQSILKKAFEGSLLSEAEIARCKQHKNYEPASVLLEKIKEEKSGITTTTKKTQRKKIKTIKKKTVVKPKTSTDIQAGVIAKVIQLHEDNPKYLDNLTHVKCEKISHLVEYHLQIPLSRVPVKDAAGPDDYNHLKKVEHRANMAGYFKVVKKEIGHTYTASKNITKAIDNLEKKINTEKKKQLDNLINLFLKFDLQSAEIIATVYAGWNNLLIDGKTPTDDEIVYESRENWSKRKLTIKRERFYKALQWMRKDEISLVPIGFGTKVLKPNKQK